MQKSFFFKGLFLHPNHSPSVMGLNMVYDKMIILIYSHSDQELPQNYVHSNFVCIGVDRIENMWWGLLLGKRRCYEAFVCQSRVPNRVYNRLTEPFEVALGLGDPTLVGNFPPDHPPPQYPNWQPADALAVLQHAGSPLAAILECPRLLGMADTMLLGRQIPCQPGPPLSAATADQYFQWLTRANTIQLLAIKGATMQKKLSAFDRFCEFMRDTGRHALQATPQDIKVHMTLWATSSGRYKHQGLDLVAPISMRCLLSFLATEFDRYATTHGNWDPLHGRGNPVRSLDVAEWATGYTRWLAHLGYNPQSAHPWSLDDLRHVLERLDARIASTTGVPLLRLHRDAFTMTILWETCSRGATAVSWCLDDLWLASGVPAAPYLFPTLHVPLGATIFFKAIELKHNLHPEVMIVTRRDGPLCPIQRLHTLLAQSAGLGHPVTQFLCRPLSANKDQFLERSLRGCL
eukprot:jgi/Botrbrau1/21234/Bobra.39_2s0033.1